MPRIFYSITYNISCEFDQYEDIIICTGMIVLASVLYLNPHHQYTIKSNNNFPSIKSKPHINLIKFYHVVKAWDMRGWLSTILDRM